MIDETAVADRIEARSSNNFKLSTLLHGSHYGHKDFTCKDTTKEYFKRETKRNDAKKIKQFSDENHEVRGILERDKVKKLRILSLEQ